MESQKLEAWKPPLEGGDDFGMVPNKLTKQPQWNVVRLDKCQFTDVLYKHRITILKLFVKHPYLLNILTILVKTANGAIRTSLAGNTLPAQALAQMVQRLASMAEDYYP